MPNQNEAAGNLLHLLSVFLDLLQRKVEKQTPRLS